MNPMAQYKKNILFEDSMSNIGESANERESSGEDPIVLEGENTLRCYILDVWESIFHSFKIFNSSLFQLMCTNDEMGLKSRMNSYINSLC